jgi:hypothetical protein
MARLSHSRVDFGGASLRPRLQGQLQQLFTSQFVDECEWDAMQCRPSRPSSPSTASEAAATGFSRLQNCCKTLSAISAISAVSAFSAIRVGCTAIPTLTPTPTPTPSRYGRRWRDCRERGWSIFLPHTRSDRE